jgi:hypothetical protein
LPAGTACTEVVGTSVCTEGLRLASVASPLKLPEARTAQKMTNAIRRLTPGPARITAMRFHGACM